MGLFERLTVALMGLGRRRAPDDTPDQRVIGMYLERLMQVRRAVGIAGGPRKVAAIRGALRGGGINVMVTDRPTAARLLEDPGPRIECRRRRAPRGGRK